MATLASDDFNRANSSSLGSDWSEVSGDWEISSNALVLASDVGGADAESYEYITWETALNASPAADYDVSCDINPTNASGIAGRLTDGSNQMMVRLHTVNQSLVLRKYVAGAVTTLGSYSGGYSAGNVYTIKLSMAGTTFNVYADTILRIGPVTDSSISAEGKAAIKADSVTPTFDNFLVEGTAASGGGPVYVPRMGFINFQNPGIA